MTYIITLIVLALGGVAFTDVAPDQSDMTTAITVILEGE